MPQSPVPCPLPPEARAPSVPAIAGLTDAHCHVFGPESRYPLPATSPFDPPALGVTDYRIMAATLGIARQVLVQPSVYGTDNRCLTDAIAEMGPKTTRGVAVVDESVSDAELGRLNGCGIRGVRINMMTSSVPADWLPVIGARIAELGWHMELWANGLKLQELTPALAQVPVPVVIGHMGLFPIAEGTEGAQFRNILTLLKDPEYWVKLIGYRLSQAAPGYGDMITPSRKMLEVAGDRCVWGTDWPHIFLNGVPMPNTTDLYEAAAALLSPAEMQAVFVANPARLYDF